MTAYDRDAMIERHQIREISLNVARRLHQVLDRNQYIPAAMRPEIDASVRVITGIQRDIDQIMSGLPSEEALDFAILTHIMGGQRHALDLLEILEQKLEGSRGAYQRDSARVHEALLAVSREIERDALRYATEPKTAAPRTQGQRSAPPPRQPATHGQRQQTRGAPAPAPSTRPAPQKTQRKPAAPGAGIAAGVRTFITRPVPLALSTLALGAGGTFLALTLLKPTEDTPADHQAAAVMTAAQPQDNHPKADSEADTHGAASETRTPAAGAMEKIAVTAPNLEQPYLVVLTTRRSTEELQQDYRGFKASYPDLLGSAKARVDRVQGQDQETYYRLSLIPPRAHGEAKTLCSNLRKAGLSGCWIKPVPLR